MKRTIALFCALVLLLAFAPAAFADVDLSGMSYDELVALKDQINLAIWNSEKWQEVEVPQGVWEVGADIPAGKWTIKALPQADTYVKVGDSVKNGGTDVNSKMSQHVMAKDYRNYDPKSDVAEYTVILESGQYVQIDYGPAVFTPYAGKPSLGFK